MGFCVYVMISLIFVINLIKSLRDYNKVQQRLQLMVAGMKLSALVQVWAMVLALRGHQCGFPEKSRGTFYPDHSSLASVQLKQLKV